MKKLLIIGLFVALGGLLAFTHLQPVAWDKNTPVSELLLAWGDGLPGHALAEVDPVKVRLGMQLVNEGRATVDGGKSAFISKFYVCTDCHRLGREDPILTQHDPEARLRLAIEQKDAFLQGTTFWGIVNRETFYNDDYKLKYGDLVDDARHSLEGSIQLCAKECSSGRYLKDWEVEAIIHYYWTLQLTLGDLDLSDADWRGINSSSRNTDHTKDVELLKAKYAQKSPAHFGDWPEDTSSGYAVAATPDPVIGKEIYERSCQTCHRKYGCSQLILEQDKLTYAKFARHLGKNTKYNLYEIIRKGTYAELGHPQYMPMYPKERMSDWQIECLRAFMESEL